MTLIKQVNTRLNKQRFDIYLVVTLYFALLNIKQSDDNVGTSRTMTTAGVSNCEYTWI
jgi:hypothetical protein